MPLTDTCAKTPCIAHHWPARPAPALPFLPPPCYRPVLGLLYVMLVDRASAEATWSYTAAASTDGGMCIAECLAGLLLAVSHRRQF